MPASEPGGLATSGSTTAEEEELVDFISFRLDDLRTRIGAPGDFVQACVLAHEIGQHVQTLLGIELEVRNLQHSHPRMRNECLVPTELETDCLAGVWGNTAARREILEFGDIEEGMRVASAIGDDRIQLQTTGGVIPDAFTHGSSEQ